MKKDNRTCTTKRGAVYIKAKIYIYIYKYEQHSYKWGRKINAKGKEGIRDELRRRRRRTTLAYARSTSYTRTECFVELVDSRRLTCEGVLCARVFYLYLENYRNFYIF